MGFFGQGHYTDRDGERHRVKDIPEFGSRSAPRTMSEDAAVVNTRIAKRNHDRAMHQQRKAQEAAQKKEDERQKKLAAKRAAKAEADRQRAAQKKADKEAKKAARKSR